MYSRFETAATTLLIFAIPMDILQQGLAFCSQAFEQLIEKIQYFTGLSQVWATIIFWLVLGYLVIFLIVIPLHRSLKKKKI